MTNNPGSHVTRTVVAAADVEAIAEGLSVLVVEGSLQALNTVAPISATSGAYRVRPII